MMTTSALQLPCQLYSSRFSSDRAQQLVGLGGKDGAIYVYPFEEYTQIARLEGDASPLTSLVFDMHQRSVVGGSDRGKISLWDISTEKFIRSFGEGHKSTVTDMDYHRCTDFIATCSRDRSLRIWDTRKKSCLQSYKGASAALCATRFTPNGRWAVSGCAEGVIRLYDLVSGKELREFQAHNGAITSIHFHPEQYYMAVGSSDGSVSLWEMENFTKVFQSGQLDTPIDAVHLFGKKMLVAADHLLRVYDFGQMSDSTASSIESPWNIIGDLTYSSIHDEAWFVEFSGSTAHMGRLSLTQQKGAPQVASSTASSSLKQQQQQQIQKPRQQQPQEQEHRPIIESKNVKPLVPTSPPLQNQKNVCNTINPVDIVKNSYESPIDDLLSSSATMLSILQRRLTHIRVVRSLWVRDPKEALEYIKRLCVEESEIGVVTDFLVAMQNMRMKERIKINTLPDLLDILLYALKNEQESLLLNGLKVFGSMNSRFRAQMDEARRFAASFRNVDPGAQKSIMQQYHEVSLKFDDVALLVYELKDKKGAVGELAREVLNELPPVSKIL
ncbi:putative katanin [Trypanosoma theileri]|uniref:Putative katanin n=1 Tax=Trypanosoma theileri TaxID=67003 RepID=A0A1X0P573_9TRYP|nr:putative katanin [Trypanosoma theileri]ORC91988.1 putative katanin [Trypanosoma theileri]